MIRAININQSRIGALALATVFVWGNSQALTIDLTYGTGFTGDADKKAVAQAAASMWEDVILMDYTVAITVQEKDLSGEGAGTLARMIDNTQSATANATTGTKLPTGGTVEMSTAMGIDWFYDTTPTGNTEFDMNSRGGRVGDAKAGSDAENKYDALSILLHEMGHILGFSGGTGTWNDGEPFTKYDAWADNMNGSTFEFDWLLTGLEGSKTGAGGTQTTVDMDGASGFHIDPADIVAVMNPYFDLGDRRLITPIEYEMIADAFHVQVVPIPAAAWLFGSALGLLGWLKRKAT